MNLIRQVHPASILSDPIDSSVIRICLQAQNVIVTIERSAADIDPILHAPEHIDVFHRMVLRQ